MKKIACKLAIIQSILLLFLSLSFAAATPAVDVTSPAYWHTQAMNDLIPFWGKTIDKENGGFFTDVEEDGTVSAASNKYTRMQSRIVYGFCAAYMLSGDDTYLALAKHGMDYMAEYCADKTYGGWHTTLDELNEPDNGSKNLFDETYGSLGPIFYYTVTRDKTALSLVSKTHAQMQAKAWDRENGGYYAYVSYNWGPATTSKSFNSQIDTFTAYLLYYYMATKDPAILSDIRQLADAVITHMVDSKTGFVGESFSSNWTWTDMNLWAGHNLKTGWVLTRVYNLTGDKKYLDAANIIAKAQMKYMWDAKFGGWFFRFMADDPKNIDDLKDWWTQEEGNMLMLSMYNNTGGKEYLEKFRKSAQFWDKHFIDRKYGECYQSTLRDGSPMNRKKADMYKSAYHTMEQALFSYLYLSLYVYKTDATLYFSPGADTAGEKMYVNLLEDKSVIITGVEIDGKTWTDFNAEEGSIALPAGAKMKVRVVYGVKK